MSGSADACYGCIFRQGGNAQKPMSSYVSGVKQAMMERQEQWRAKEIFAQCGERTLKFDEELKRP